MKFRGIGELAGIVMQRISSGDFPLWSDELGGDLGSNPGADARPCEGNEIQVFGRTIEAAADGELAGGTNWPQGFGTSPAPSATLTPEDGASVPETSPARRQARKLLRGELVVIRGGRTVTHAAADRATPRPAVRLHLIAGGAHAATAWRSSN